jgi:hypothetical protein
VRLWMPSAREERNRPCVRRARSDVEGQSRCRGTWSDRRRTIVIGNRWSSARSLFLDIEHRVSLAGRAKIHPT